MSQPPAPGPLAAASGSPTAEPLAARAVEPPSAEVPSVELVEAARWYGNVVAVSGISFALGPGITGLLGPNGAGKSTLLHLIAGLLRPSAGSVRIGGRAAWRDPEVYRQVGLVPEREAVPGFLSGHDFVLLNARLQGLTDPAEAARRAIELVDLGPAAARPIATYSKGMRQRAKVAAALVHEPRVLLLDEPFNGLDPRQRLHLMGLLRTMAAEGRCIVVSSHILEEVERVAERVLVVYAGRLAASGDFRQLRRLMTDRPHTFTLRTSDDRRLAGRLVADPAVEGVEVGRDRLTVRTADFAAFTHLLPRLAREAAVSLFEVRPTDESLESVFAYLVSR